MTRLHIAGEQPRGRDRGPTPIASGEVEDVVALVPGFLGFERLGGFAYFADQIAATLRAALEASRGRRTPVLPLTTFPAGSLASRQEALLDQLARCVKLYRPRRIHLVGHSSGGLDAYFLTARTSMFGLAWTAAQREARARIASIVTMGTPFLGTTLSDSEVAQFLGGNSLTPPPLREALGIVLGLGHLVAENAAALERFAAISAGIPAAAGLVRQLTRHRELIGDISPKRMCERYERFTPDLEPALTCFASYVAPPARDNSTPLFRRLYDYTAQGAHKPAGAEHVRRNKELLEDALVLGHADDRKVRLDEASSDGVVNTLRQLPPQVRKEQVAALVVADHADLLGYFDRMDPTTGREQQVSIFRSGATFREDQFFELFQRVAAALLSSIP